MKNLTKNTIVLCDCYNTMESLAEKIIAAAKKDIGRPRYEVNFGLQKVININGLKITLCLEPAMIYKAKRIGDIWFAYNDDVYKLTEFKGCRKDWAGGLDQVYRYIVSGRYGCYTGSWLKV